METSDYIKTYLEALPEHLRPDNDSPKMNTLCVKAKANGWSPTDLATRVAGGTNWSTISTPIGYALTKLEAISKTEANAPVKALGIVTDAHCRRAGCMCKHDLCNRGWMESEPIIGFKDMAYDAVKFCPTCRPEQHDIMFYARTREEGLEKLQLRK